LQAGFACGDAHLLESLGCISHAFAGELRQAGLVQAFWNAGNTGPMDYRDLLEDFGKRG
jgi:hypothetical protein